MDSILTRAFQHWGRAESLHKGGRPMSRIGAHRWQLQSGARPSARDAVIAPRRLSRASEARTPCTEPSTPKG